MKLLDFLKNYSCMNRLFSKTYIDFYQYELELHRIESFINEIEYKKKKLENQF